MLGGTRAATVDGVLRRLGGSRLETEAFQLHSLHGRDLEATHPIELRRKCTLRWRFPSGDTIAEREGTEGEAGLQFAAPRSRNGHGAGKTRLSCNVFTAAKNDTRFERRGNG